MESLSKYFPSHNMFDAIPGTWLHEYYSALGQQRESTMFRKRSKKQEENTKKYTETRVKIEEADWPELEKKWPTMKGVEKRLLMMHICEVIRDRFQAKEQYQKRPWVPIDWKSHAPVEFGKISMLKSIITKFGLNNLGLAWQQLVDRTVDTDVFPTVRMLKQHLYAHFNEKEVLWESELDRDGVKKIVSTYQHLDKKEQKKAAKLLCQYLESYFAIKEKAKNPNDSNPRKWRLIIWEAMDTREKEKAELYLRLLQELGAFEFMKVAERIIDELAQTKYTPTLQIISEGILNHYENKNVFP